MHTRAGLAAGLFLAAGLYAQDAVQIYRIDLVGGAKSFALSAPKLEGGTYLYRGWPDGALVRVKKEMVRNVTPWTRNPVQDIAYRIDVLPSGHYLSRDNPVLKGSTYVFRTSRDGTVMSVRQADVQKITKLTGSDAFWAEQGTRGEVTLGTLAMSGGSSQAGPSNLTSAGQGVRAGPRLAPQPSNWLYQGQPGVTDAWAPASATVSTPGDVPRLPAATDGQPAPQ
jgi:hypothetical protein